MPTLNVSIVIPTFNRAAGLERALGSALLEVRPGDEIVVVDDGSTDDTEAVVRRHGPHVRYVHIEHVGAGAARNAGVQAASGDVVAFLDSDDEWTPGKVSWQRATMEAFPNILFLFSDFGGVTPFGERLRNQARAWHGDAPFWDELLAPGVASVTIPGLEPSAPPFSLYTGNIYETIIRRWSIFTCTVMVRRQMAGDALHFAEDVGIYEDLECFARLAQRGTAGYMDCETAWQHAYVGPRLTDADLVTSGEAALRIIARVWGADEAYLRDHRRDYEEIMDRHRRRKIRGLLSQGRGPEARQEVVQLTGPSPRLYAQSLVPGRATRLAAAARRELRSHLQAPSPPSGGGADWRLSEFTGRLGLRRLESDWRRLCLDMPHSAGGRDFDAHRLYVERVASAPEEMTYLALSDGHKVRAICPLEKRTRRVSGLALAAWNLRWPPLWPFTDVVAPEDEAREVLLPLVADHLRTSSGGRHLLAVGPLPASSSLWVGLRLMNHADYFVRPAGSMMVFDCESPVTVKAAREGLHLHGNLRSARRRLESLSAVRFVTAVGGTEFEAELRSFLEVEVAMRRASVAGEPARYSSRVLPAYFHGLTSALQDEARFEIHAVYIEGRCIASHLCLRSAEDFTIVGSVCDRDYCTWDSCAVLLQRMLEACREDPGIKRVYLVTETPWWRGPDVDVRDLRTAELACGGWQGRLAVFGLRLQARLAREVRDRPRLSSARRSAVG